MNLLMRDENLFRVVKLSFVYEMRFYVQFVLNKLCGRQKL